MENHINNLSYIHTYNIALLIMRITVVLFTLFEKLFHRKLIEKDINLLNLQTENKIVDKPLKLLINKE